jgi:hypothetical protein
VAKRCVGHHKNVEFKLGHSRFQNWPPGVETGQYRHQRPPKRTPPRAGYRGLCRGGGEALAAYAACCSCGTVRFSVLSQTMHSNCCRSATSPTMTFTSHIGTSQVGQLGWIPL